MSNLVGLALVLMRRDGLGRFLALTVATAGAAVLATVALSWALGPRESGSTFGLVENWGTRPGVVLGAALVSIAPLLLLRQVARLGAASRERRWAGLLLAGAGPAQVRAIGRVMALAPCVAGVLLSLLLVELVRATTRGLTFEMTAGQGPDSFTYVVEFSLLPASDPIPWWARVLLLVSVGGIATLAAGTLPRAARLSPLGLTSRQPRQRPRPWGFALLGVALLLMFGLVSVRYSSLGIWAVVWSVGAILLATVGLLQLPPWLAWRAGQLVARRTRSGATLLAAQQLVSDPRPAGRSSATIGAAFLFIGGATGLFADEATGRAFEDDSEFVIGTALFAVGLGVALLVALIGIAVHSVEARRDRRRASAALVAQGVPVATLHRARLREVVIVAVPVAALGALLGSATIVGLLTADRLAYDSVSVAEALPLPVALVLGSTLFSAAVVAVIALVAVALTRPWVRDLGSPEHLRTA